MKSPLGWKVGSSIHSTRSTTTASCNHHHDAATRLLTLIRIWEDAAQTFADTARGLPANALHRRAHLLWSAKQIIQHVAHIECALMRVEITGARRYEATNMAEYVDAGAESLSELSQASLSAALDAAATARDHWFREDERTDSDIAHWTAVATDRILDLWVHTYDLCTLARRDATPLFETRAGRFSMRHFINRLPRVERKAQQISSRADLRFVVSLTSPHGGYQTIWRSNEPADGAPGSVEFIELSFESFVGVCSGRPFGQADDYVNSSNPAVRAFAAAANHFVLFERGSMSAQKSLNREEQDRVERLLGSERMTAEDRAMLLESLSFGSEGRGIVLSAYEQTNL